MVANHFKSLFETFIEIAQQNEQYLGDLDSLNGDGDLGITFKKVMNSMSNSLNTMEHSTDIGVMLKEGSMDIFENAASTMGTLLASGFNSAGKALKGAEKLEKAELVLFYTGFVEGIQRRGKAKLGEKTILDVLIPVQQYLVNSSELDLKVLLTKASEVAEKAVEDTKLLKAVHGRAARYENASEGLYDPGSVAGMLITKGFKQYFTN